MRLLLIADPHPGAPHIDQAKLERAVALANAERPDLVVLMGDYISGGLFSRFVPPEPSAQILSRIKAPLGVYAILGNHDWWFDGPRVTKALEDNGIPVLENRALTLNWQGRDIWLAGVGDLTTHHDDLKAALAQIPAKGPVLLAMHHPDLFPQVPRHIALTVSAHTHGGQVRLPFVGPLIVPSRYWQRYAYGVVDEGKGPMVVSGSLGTSIVPVRIGAVPELTLITLKAAPPR